MIQHHIKEQSKISVTYFVSDKRKAGDRYVTASGHVKMPDEAEHVIIMADGAKIPIEDVRYIEGDLYIVRTIQRRR